MTLSNGTLKVTLNDVIAGSDHTIGLQRNYAERDDRIDDQDAVLVFTIAEGQVSAVQEFWEDTTRGDQFWS